MNDDTAIVLNGFFNLPNLEKLKVVEAINDYFDSNDREPIRQAALGRFAEIDTEAHNFKCNCCMR